MMVVVVSSSCPCGGGGGWNCPHTIRIIVVPVVTKIQQHWHIEYVHYKHEYLLPLVIPIPYVFLVVTISCSVPPQHVDAAEEEDGWSQWWWQFPPVQQR
jgi:hypothetical protein